MKDKVKMGIVCISFLLAAVLICAEAVVHSADQNNEGSRRKKIGVLYMTMNNPYFEVINQEIETVVEGKGDILYTRDSNLDNEMQIRQMKEMIQQDMDIILINSVNWQGIEPALDEAKEAGIPVIAIDTEVRDANKVTATITSDNYTAGVLIAKDLMSRCDGGRILLLQHEGNKSGEDRINAFLNTLDKEKWPYEIVDTLECYGQLEIAEPLVEKVLDQNEHIDIVMALNDPGALGAMAALDARGLLEDVIVYGVDGAPEAKSMINNKKMTGTVAQSPTKTGQTAANEIYDILENKDVKKETILPVTLINQDNIDGFSLTNWE